MNDYFNPKEILTGLRDFRFKNFITQKVIKVLYLISIAFSAVFGLMVLVSGLSSGSLPYALVSVILAPVLFIAYVLMARVSLELIMVLFRISDNLQALAVKKGAISPEAPKSEDNSPAENGTEQGS